MTLTFDLGSHRDYRSYTSWYFVKCKYGGTQCKFWIYYDYSFWIYGPLGQHSSDWSCDLATLIFDLGGHGACGWYGSSSSTRIPSLKFIGLAIRKIWRTMCVSINGPSNPDLWPSELQTGMQVASKGGNLPSKFGHARPLDSRIIRYVRDGWTDRQTDGRTDEQTQRLLPPSLRRHNNYTVFLHLCQGGGHAIRSVSLSFRVQ